MTTFFRAIVLSFNEGFSVGSFCQPNIFKATFSIPLKGFRILSSIYFFVLNYIRNKKAFLNHPSGHPPEFSKSGGGGTGAAVFPFIYWQRKCCFFAQSPVCHSPVFSSISTHWNDSIRSWIIEVVARKHKKTLKLTIFVLYVPYVLYVLANR